MKQITCDNCGILLNQDKKLYAVELNLRPESALVAEPRLKIDLCPKCADRISVIIRQVFTKNQIR